jgi:hypothetical protein
VQPELAGSSVYAANAAHALEYIKSGSRSLRGTRLHPASNIDPHTSMLKLTITLLFAALFLATIRGTVIPGTFIAFFTNRLSIDLCIPDAAGMNLEGRGHPETGATAT